MADCDLDEGGTDPGRGCVLISLESFRLIIINARLMARKTRKRGIPRIVEKRRTIMVSIAKGTRINNGLNT